MKEMKEVLAFAFEMFNAYKLADADGKIDLTDLGLLIGPITKLVPAMDNIGGSIDELKNMTNENRTELMTWAKAEFDIADDELEMKIEQGVDLMLHLAQFLGVMGVFGGDDQSPEPAA